MALRPLAASIAWLNWRVGGGRIYAISSRHASRERYGSEEGHAEKNEVRGDNWWRKRNPHRKIVDWRGEQKLHPHAVTWGPLSQTADWSFQDGQPGVLNEKQRRMRADNIRLVNEVHQAAVLVMKAKQFEKKKPEDGSRPVG